ncbi:MAG TPA: sigma-70 family RNA polymerase sigma factor [Candidatus Baltobacteraceae bacterium]|nr:sigma-70 family RNA polymerase sigma factor [Candidatus Baltobacteraceae bacterium]
MDPPSSQSTRSADAAERHALEAAFVAREAWAFEAAYEAYRRHLYGAAFGVLHDAGNAQDCVHDVLLRLWRQGHAYSAARGSLQAFLVVCVRNEALSRLRKSQNRERIVRDHLRVADSVPAADESSAARLDMAQSIARLSAAQQQAICLAYYEGLTHEQIAQRLGEPVGTVKSRLSNALRTLRTLLQGEES